MQKNKLFVVAIAFVICLGFMPSLREMREHFSQTQAAKLELVPLLGEQELAQEIEQVITQFKDAQTADDFFFTVAKQQRAEVMIEKFAETNGIMDVGGYSYEVLRRRMNGAMSFASESLQAKFGLTEMAQARESRHKELLKPLESSVQTTTSTGLYLLYGIGWSMFVMFLVFTFRAQSLMHFMYELVSGRLLLASVAWPFFAAEYMKVAKDDYRSVAAMARFAAVNLSILLSAFLSAGIASAQSTKKAKSQGKRSSVVIIDTAAEIEGGKNADGLIAVSTKDDDTLLEGATIIGKTSQSFLGLAGRKISGDSPVSVDLYGGYRADFKRNLPDSQRFLGGLRIFASKPLNKSHTLQFNSPFTQFEQYVKPKLKSAFFSTGQLYDRYKGRFRFGGEYSFRKEQGNKPYVAGGPFAGYNLFKNVRVEGLLLYSNAGPPRFRLRTVVAF